MTREEAIRIFRREIECLSHAKCEDCILEKVCDPAKTTPFDSEYIEAYGMAIQALSQEPLSGIKENISKYMKKYPNHVGNIDFWNGFYACRNIVEHLDEDEQEPICDHDCEHCTWTECPIEPCTDAVSRQAVINAIENDCMKGGLGSCFACYNDAQAFRGEIEKLPSVNPQPCDDAISREAVCEIISDIRDCISVEGYWAILERLKKLPSVTPSRHKGHWIKGINTYFNTEAYRCSECNYHTVYKHDICPNCKAEMESSDAE